MLSLPTLADHLIDHVVHLVELVGFVVEDAVADHAEKTPLLPRLVGDNRWLRILAQDGRRGSTLSISSTM